jgi:hypothetical protein
VEIDLWCRSPSAYSCICLSSNHGGEWKKGGGRPQGLLSDQALSDGLPDWSTDSKSP